MDILLMADSLTSAAAHGLGVANLLLRPAVPSVCISDPSPDQPPPATSPLQISAAAFPAVQSSSCKTLPRRIRQKRRRTRRISLSGDDSDIGNGAFYGDDSAGGDGPYDGGSGFYGGGGGGWNFGGYGSDDSSSRSQPGSSFAFDFIYEVVYWIAFASCTHFAFKKAVRIAADVISDAGRERVPIRLTAMY